MTTEATLPSTSVSPTARQLWTRSRGIALALLVLLAGAVTVATVRSDARHGELDPRSADPLGSRAVTALLADRGVTTRLVTTLAEARAATGPDTTLLVAVPDRLTERQQRLLHSATTGSGGRTVLVAAGGWSVGTLAPGVTADPATSRDSTLDPGCDLPAARRAGPADTGGIRYTSTRPDADECYPSSRLPTLLRLPDTAGQGDTVLLGGPDILLNERLDEQGNASLALQLLGSRPHLVWYLPSLSDTTATGPEDEKSFFDLVPSGWLWGTLQLFIAAALAALWRARRLGPLVPEKLPVAIRASETVEGRARLYRKANARDRAAAALRSTTRTRLAPLVGIPVAQAHTPEALVPALSAHLHGDGRPLHSLLFGPPPSDDADLVSLADRLDALEREVRRP
ncbi:DUF4350 domain-containing protein [Streptomyces longwoodensis]|uniref:DUF4350 domain-containing protein n=1 Tax=Streptomyces longwoodensis TaxID=68231 RepID=UPI002DD96B24|nr:DUF4350 domain-containing protein [Streptomyces longwoodensis]WRY88989.1 DUF4350 domain-containing protein [Streptomyces longwoodensis]WUC59527.1 DUF4350 domain-containing protein [Streptomyces longwoodensis]